ncbi:MAG TPA: SRPBCC family protein [Syntrophobacteria bacterium]|nr:SRPBCC family protein [Syntrophobacteria bacterium]
MVIDEEITIRAPLGVVWQVFSGFENWDDWTSACQMCHYQEGSEMAAGTCVSFVVRPFVFPVRVAPRIMRCDPGRELVWEGGRLGIYAVHRWRFREGEGKVTLSSSERFSGPLLRLGRLLFLPHRLHRLTRELLRSIKAEAERRFRGQHSA